MGRHCTGDLPFVAVLLMAVAAYGWSKQLCGNVDTDRESLRIWRARIAFDTCTLRPIETNMLWPAVKQLPDFPGGVLERRVNE